MAFELSQYDIPKAAEIGYEFEPKWPRSQEEIEAQKEPVGMGFFIKVRGEEAQSVRLDGIQAAAEAIVKDKIENNSKVKKTEQQQIKEMVERLSSAIEKDTPERAAKRVIAYREALWEGHPATLDDTAEILRRYPFLIAQVMEASRDTGKSCVILPTTSAPTPKKSSS